MKRTWPFMFYMAYFAAGVFLQPNIVLYLQKLGFTGAQIGLLSAITPIVVMLGAPLWTGLADAHNRHKLIMSLTIIISIITASIFPLVRTFESIIPFVILYALVAAPTTSFADSATMTMLGDDKAMYGRVRLGGTFGWGLVALLAGPIIGAYGIQWAFWGYSVIMIFALLFSLKFSYAQKPRQESLAGDIRQVLIDRRWILFLALAFVGGIAFTAMNSFLFPYMEELNIGSSTRSIALTIATISELPIFFFANYLLKRFKAHGLMTLAMLITGIRLILYGLLNFQAGILGFQVLNGLTYPLFWVAGVSYANEISPAGMKSTAQGLVGAMVFGFGAAAGGLACGLLLGGPGGQWLFLSIGIFVLICVTVIGMIERVQRAPQARSLG